MLGLIGATRSVIASGAVGGLHVAAQPNNMSFSYVESAI
jgi:hypothetical protein